MLETLDYTIRTGSTPTFLYFYMYLKLNGLKYDKLIKNSGNIVYFGYVRFSALLGKLSKLQQ